MLKWERSRKFLRIPSFPLSISIREDGELAWDQALLLMMPRDLELQSSPQEGGLHDLITLVVSSRVYIMVLSSQALISPWHETKLDFRKKCGQSSYFSFSLACKHTYFKSISLLLNFLSIPDYKKHLIGHRCWTWTFVVTFGSVMTSENIPWKEKLRKQCLAWNIFCLRKCLASSTSLWISVASFTSCLLDEQLSISSKSSASGLSEGVSEGWGRLALLQGWPLPLMSFLQW